MTAVRSQLAQVRKHRKLSREALAQIAGVRVGTLRSLEDGTARMLSLTTLARICEVLHCQPGDLFEMPLDDHRFPVLGGPDEDEILQSRHNAPGTLLDGPEVMASLVRATRAPH